jgi:hypothetical protein
MKFQLDEQRHKFSKFENLLKKRKKDKKSAKQKQG